MWDLTHSGYDDNVYNKGHPYHMDNCLPAVELSPSNTPTYKPHNLIAFPIYKGCGYSITYDKTYTLAKFPN